MKYKNVAIKNGWSIDIENNEVEESQTVLNEILIALERTVRLRRFSVGSFYVRN